MASEEAVIPLWAADIRESVAEIKGLTSQIPALTRLLEELRASTVPMSEHIRLMKDVEELTERDVGQRDTWDKVVKQNEEMWIDHVKQLGARRTYTLWLGIVSLVLALLTAFSILTNLGLVLSVQRPHP